MSQAISRSNDISLVADREFRKAIKEMQEAVKEKHNEVSNEETNPNHVKQKAGLDYVEFSYMKNKAHEHYPGWSFKNLKIVHEMLISGWVVVTGEIHFIDEGIPRTGAVAAAHRIAFKKGHDRVPEHIVDLGNDVKAAVSDAMKKGFNVYMNISDDIYKSIEIVDIDNDQKMALYKIVEECPASKQTEFYNYIDNRTTKSNVSTTAKRLLGALYKHKASNSDVEEEDILKEIESLKTDLNKVGIELD